LVSSNQLTTYSLVSLLFTTDKGLPPTSAYSGISCIFGKACEISVHLIKTGMSYSRLSIAAQFKLGDIGDICENGAIESGERCGGQTWT
jgi:hypothetical protein